MRIVMSKLANAFAAAALLGLFSPQAALAQGVSPDLCSAGYERDSFKKGKEIKEFKGAIETIEKYGTVPWYTDNVDETARMNMLNGIADRCGDPKLKIPMVVYGLPNKECDSGMPNIGRNTDDGAYEKFINQLADRFKTQNMVYVLEPSAFSLAASGGCGAGYLKLLEYAIKKLAGNNNAEIFIDVGYWTLGGGKVTDEAINVFKRLRDYAAQSVKGITLNTANYKPTVAMHDLCDKFAAAVGDDNIRCVIDTSRNFKSPSSNQWCNSNIGGIGEPPQKIPDPKYRAAYYLWIKSPGESDGTCEKQPRNESMAGPNTGEFFKEHFQMLWNNGYFVAKDSAKPIDIAPSNNGGIQPGQARTWSIPSKIWPICTYKSPTYVKAKEEYKKQNNQELQDAVDVIMTYGTAAWYKDTMTNETRNAMLDALKSTCGEETKIPLVVYGIPQKDCEGGNATAGSVKNPQMYMDFIAELTKRFTKHHMVYILEPGALALLSKGGCGTGYLKALQYAIGALSKNENAEIYLEASHWATKPEEGIDKMVEAIKKLWDGKSKALKGITLNTSNYQKNKVVDALCMKYAHAMDATLAKLPGPPEFRCIVDTSRNYRGSSPSNVACNAKTAGIGAPPTMVVDPLSPVSYRLWVKPPGESDGMCANQPPNESVSGTEGGAFSDAHFQLLWKNSIFAGKISKPQGAQQQRMAAHTKLLAKAIRLRGGAAPAPTRANQTPVKVPMLGEPLPGTSSMQEFLAMATAMSQPEQDSIRSPAVVDSNPAPLKPESLTNLNFNSAMLRPGTGAGVGHPKNLK